MKNETIMAIVVIALIAVVAIQTVQIFTMNSQTQKYTPTGMASGVGSTEGFSSVEEMMQAHHGGETVGGC